MFYIALCDDEWQAVEILTGYLSEIKRSGLQLESVPFLNGRELVHQYERGRKFDIIILDMLMKPLNGIETARLIRKYDSEVPILIVTGTVEYAMDGYQVNANISAKMDVDADLANNKYTLKDNTIRLNAIQAGIDGWVELKDPAIDMDLKLNTNDEIGRASCRERV